MDAGGHSPGDGLQPADGRQPPEEDGDEMKRVKTKHRDAGRRKQMKKTTDEVVGYMLILCYAAMKDEFDLDLDQCRAWKARMDRYAGYLAKGTLTLDEFAKDLKKIGLEV